MSEKRGQFSGGIGYVLAAAGSAVGLGNIWRFPYLAARYGGGIFVLIYIIFVVTFGFTLIVTETALGRKTGKSPVGAFTAFSPKKKSAFGGWFNAVIPMLILPYYSVIGGWVVKYLFEFITGNGKALADTAYFNTFVVDSVEVEVFFIAFILFTFFVVMGGVKKGVEAASRIMMPILVVLAVCIAGYSVTRPGALEGVKYFLVPDFKNFSILTIVAALQQMFYSLSLAMGILYTYGSYLKKDVDIEKSTFRVGIFDTAIAILAGLMIIPAVFAYSGGDKTVLNAGPSLMFVTLPKVFASMKIGGFIGSTFFIMVFFAALTSTISLLETSISTWTDELHISRRTAIFLMFVITMVLGSCSSFGFGIWDHITLFGMSILDFFDFLTNQIMMPLAALFTCILVYRCAGIKTIEDEVLLSSEFRMKRVYKVVIKYIVPVCLVIIFIVAILSAMGIIAI